ncbi:hypothetical protein MMU55_001278 [Campylobacter jejuni]|uniref:DUF945 domain-containing protein n=1 Tax=Campylobacter jejuni TaxID=197 RepID=A0AB36G6J9_CAMJU|nr:MULTISPECIES: hypothetical protein [unclassified Campylobacter]EIY3537812.1 hypothetical protein [Campylobacter jejuni]EMA2809876.1 hypothetical protein [Campylobacter jejuni]OEV45869.1 hypothetical protein AJY60_07685 [Campylobacter jejuni]OEW67559.1 hypothetical protein AJN59_04965 [Campylobacter sp. BCW_4322]OEW76759.1 hypothetical protein AJN65_06675 [Campylobacter sp. BCW_4333]
MKKWIFIVFCFILGFIIHIFYIGYTNELLFNKFIKNSNPDYTITDIYFKKGFLTSKGSFTLNHSHTQLSTKINLKFNNYFFLDKIIKGNFTNPFDFLDEVLKNNQLGTFTLKLHDNNSKIFLNIKDINLSNEGGDTIINGGYIEALMNKNLEIKNIKIHFDMIDFSQFYTKFILQNLNYEQFFNNPVQFYELNLFSDSQQEINFDYLVLDNNKINSFYSKNQVNFNEENSAINLNIQGKSNEIDIDLKSLLGQNLNFDKTKFNITINKFLNSNFNISHFIQKNLDLEIQNLILEKNKQNISLQGNLNINNSYQAKLQVISSDEPDEIFPWTKDYGGLNQYFLKENNNFFLNLSYDSLANPQLKINGSEFSNMDLN